MSAQPAGSALGRFARRGRWVPWVLFLIQLAVTAVVVDILSVILFVQLTLVPGAILGELDAVWTLVFSIGFTVVAEAVGAVVLFGVTGFLVGVLGLPIRLIGPLRRLWLGNGELTIIGVALGLFLLLASYLLAFSLSMLVWPARWMPTRLRRWWKHTQLTKRAQRQPH